MPRTEIDHLVAEDTPTGDVSLFDANLGGEVLISAAAIDRLIDFLADRLPGDELLTGPDGESEGVLITDLAAYSQREGVTVNSTRPAAALGAQLVDAATGQPADVAELQRRRDEVAARRSAEAVDVPPLDVPPFLLPRLTVDPAVQPTDLPPMATEDPYTAIAGDGTLIHYPQPDPLDTLRGAIEQAANILLVAAANHRGAGITPTATALQGVAQ